MLGLAIVPLLVVLAVAEQPRIDCYPEPGATKEACVARGCEWNVPAEADKVPGAPYCIFQGNTGYFLDDGYTADGATLTKNPNAKNPFYENLDKLKVEVKRFGATLNIKIFDYNAPRYEVPLPFQKENSHSSTSEQFVVAFNKTAPGSTFAFTVERGGQKIWDTSIGGLLFGDQYIQIATLLSTRNIYGFGEHMHHHIRHDTTRYTNWPMFARDVGPDSKSDLSTTNLYGVHPFYMGVDASGVAYGVLLLNSNAMEVTVGTGPHLVYRTIGGILDFYFFPGPTPEDVIRQYHAFIGRPMLPAYWGLGFQLCRWGYDTLDNMKAAVKRTQDAGVPLEIVIADIDYMVRYKDFTVGWAGLPEYITELHNQGLHVTLMTDAAVQVNYPSFERARAKGARFIEWPNDKLVNLEVNGIYPLINNTRIMPGNVWPDNNTAAADFLEETNNTLNWWIEEFKLFREQTGMDTIWIDMNEISNFDTYPSTFAPTPDTKYRLRCPVEGDDGKYDNPKYPTWAKWQHGENAWLFSKTLCMAGKTGGGKYNFYDTHSLWGTTMGMATYEAQRTFGNRGAIVSRSTYPSAGRYVGHWLGDNSAHWEDLQTSVIGAQEFNMFGFSYTGSDICGFNLDTTEELCVRWHQMGAFHTFSRNHNAIGTIPQDPGQWHTVAKAAKISLLFKYYYLPYLYTLMFEAHLDGGTVLRPLFFEFPRDPGTYDLGNQFMWGSGMMFMPVVTQGVLTVTGYLPPEANWYSLRADNYGELMSKAPFQTFSVKWDETIPIFARGGTVIVRQKAANVIRDARKNPFEILVALSAADPEDGDNEVEGGLFWDDGESYLNNNYYYIDITFTYNVNNNATLTSEPALVPTNEIAVPKVQTIEILGYQCDPGFSEVNLNGNMTAVTTKYSTDRKYLTITFNVPLDLTKKNSIQWNYCTPAVETTTKAEKTTVGPTTKAEKTTVGPTTKAEKTTVGPTTKAESTTVGPTTKTENSTVGPTTKTETTTSSAERMTVAKSGSTLLFILLSLCFWLF